MKHRSSISARILFISAFTLLTLTATAQQFKKSLTSPRDQTQSSDAKWSIGIIGGPNFTTWFHIYSATASNWYMKNYYKPVFLEKEGSSIGYFGGIAVERMIKNNLSVGLNVIYSQHNIRLKFVDDHFPYTLDPISGGILYGKIVKTLSVTYPSIEAYIPVTYYTSVASTKNIKPYVYVAPRFSYVLSGELTHTTSYTDNQNNSISDFPDRSETASLDFTNYTMINVGATAGAGSLFRINLNNYYFIIKLDVSANLNCIPSFMTGDAYRLRFSSDAHATLSLMFPIKKPLKGACMKWGEYD